MKKKTITIYDIAKEAGVSPATVSRVIAKNYPVSEKTKKKVLKLIEKYDYSPNVVARSLTKKESKMLGVILPDITNPFFAQVFIEAEKYAHSKGYALLLCNSMNSSELESKYLKLLSERQVEGIVFMGGRINKSHPQRTEIKELKHIADKIPMVFINGKVDELECTSIRTDEEAGMKMIIDHLVTNEHKKIGLLGGIKGITTTDIKVKAYQKYVAENNLTSSETWQIYSGYDVRRGQEAMEQLLEINKNNTPTAIIGINDLVIIGALKHCHKNGINRFSFVGFDNSELAQNSILEITSISHPYRELGETAIDKLIEARNGESEVEDYLIDPHLVERESSLLH